MSTDQASLSTAAVAAISASTAIRQLNTLRLTPARLALERLNGLQESSQILHLYRQHFPSDFARSTASMSVPVRDDERFYSERELEFFQLVDRNLFPLPEFLFDSERLPSIPIYPAGVDWEDDRENIRLSIRVAMSLVSGEEDEAWIAWLPFGIRPECSPRDWAKFRALCHGEGGLTARLPLLFDYVTQSTGNLWMDISWEGSWEDLPWEESTVTQLSLEWRFAQVFFARLNPLLERIDKHPRYWLRRLVTLWNGAAKGISDEAMSDSRATART